MKDSHSESVEQRLDRLERANRSLKRCCTVLVAATAALMVCGGARFFDDRMVVNDSAGNKRVLAGVNPNDIDEAGIEIYDVRGVRRFWIGTDADNNARLSVFAKDGTLVRNLAQ
jgi:hypothetical protein